MRQRRATRWVRRSRRTALLIRLAPVALATLVAVPVLVTSSNGSPAPLAVLSPSPVRVAAAAGADEVRPRALAFTLPKSMPVAPVAQRLADPYGFVAAALANARTEMNARARVDAEVKAEAAAVSKPVVTAKPKTTTVKPASPKPAARTTKPVAKPSVAPVTTVPIPVTAPPVAIPPEGPYTQDQVIAIIRSIWPAELQEKAISVARRESNLVPTAHNWCCTGLFQIYAQANAATIAALGYTASQLTDPTINTIVAYAIYQRAGWAPWGF